MRSASRMPAARSLILLLLVLAAVPSPGAARSFLMGATYWPPARFPDRETTRAHRLLARAALDSGDVLHLQLPWSPGSTRSRAQIDPLHSVAAAGQRALMISLDWLEPGRQAVRGDGDWTFDDPDVRARFASLVEELAVEIRPAFLVIGVEVNFYAHLDPDGFRAFVKLYGHLRGRLRELRAPTRILVSFQYEDLLGHRPFESSVSKPSMKLVSVFNPQLLALSTYPGLVHRTPADIPQDYFEPALALDRPVLILETGWHTGGSGSEAEQAAYVRRLLTLARTKCFQLVNWASAVDTLAMPYPPEDEAQRHGVPTWAGSLGLFDMTGRPKPAAAVWQEARRIRYQSGGNCQMGP